MIMPYSHILPTPLEELVRQTQTCERVDMNKIFFPIYTVQIYVLLEMKKRSGHIIAITIVIGVGGFLGIGIDGKL